jgi:hypothetical protein
VQLAPPDHFPQLRSEPMMPNGSILAPMRDLPVLAIDFAMARRRLCFRAGNARCR